MAKCFTCPSEEIFEYHHLIPQSKGGKDGPKKGLCANCHKKAHRLAKTNIQLDDIKFEFGINMGHIVEALRLSEGLEHDYYWKTWLKLPNELHTLIKSEAQAKRKKGKKMSIQKLIIRILANHYLK